MHGGGWFAYVRGEDDKDKKQHVTWPLLKRVLGYARPYRGRIILLLGTILAVTGLSLLTPLIMRDLIDRTLPAGNAGRLNRLAIALVLIPIAGGAINIFQRKQRLDRRGCDLRFGWRLYTHRSACRCAFTHPKPARRSAA